MNLIKLIPKFIRKKYEKNIQLADITVDSERHLTVSILSSLIFSFSVAIILFFFKINPLLTFFILFLSIQLFLYFKVSLKASARLRKIEEVFPDFIQLMSSNLRAGMTIDHAFLSSARPELHPLDKEILKTGKEIATGKDVVSALKSMSKRIESEKIDKTIYLIISGLKAGGNISTLLETTASNMREKEFLEKRAASNVLMYVIFIFVSIGIGAPFLFGLSSILIEVMINLTKTLPATDVVQTNLAFTFSEIGISSAFMIYFSLIFIVVTDLISSLVIGLVNRGDEKYGLNYFLPLLLTSVSVFFLIRFLLSGFLSNLFSAIS